MLIAYTLGDVHTLSSGLESCTSLCQRIPLPFRSLPQYPLCIMQSTRDPDSDPGPEAILARFKALPKHSRQAVYA